MVSKLEIRLWQNLALDGFEVYLIERNHEGQVKSAVVNMTITEVEEGEDIPHAFTIRHELAQNLADQLWQAGIKPTEIKDASGELRATKYHLEDMRKLAKVAL